MKEIPLRAYHQEIEKMIENGSVDDAVAHCQHILKTYPMNLDTYRLLGKSFLEAKNYKDAADIFQRLLLSLPDDFVAHVGMSIIRDDEKNLNDSIWHMERAFEVQPSNPAIQEELKKLYARRDGKEPSKIRLTRDALANMYTQGALYSQAISEIRSVLDEEPDRQDLKVMLARAYYKDGRKKQAVDVCTELLQKYPYCFDALKILVSLLSAEENQQLISKYRSKLIAMDPYIENSTGPDFETQNVMDNTVMVEYMGNELTDPSLISNMNSYVQLEKDQSEKINFDNNQQVGESTIMNTISEDSDEMNLENIKPNAGVDIPDWIKELAPKNLESENEADNIETIAEESVNPKDKVAETEEPVIESSAEESVKGSLDDIPSWLREMGTDELFISEDKDETLKEIGTVENDNETSSSQQIPEWMSGEQESHIINEEQIPEPDDYELPDWLKGIESDKENEDLKTVDGFEPILQTMGNDEPENVLNDEPSSGFDVSSLEEDIESVSIPGLDEVSQSGQDLLVDEDQEFSRSEFFSESISEDILSSEIESNDSVVEKMDSEEVSSLNQETGQNDQIGDLNDADEAFAWLESLAARQGANPDELVTNPTERGLEPPDWIKDVIGEDGTEEGGEPKDIDDQMVSSGKNEQFESALEFPEGDKQKEEFLQQEQPEMELPEELGTELEKGMVQAEITDNLEQIMDPIYNIHQEQDIISESGEWSIKQESISDSSEIEKIQELTERSASIELTNDENFKEESGEEIESKDEVENISMRGDWKPLDESGDNISSETMTIPQPELINSEEEVSQQERVPMSGSITKIPGEDTDKEIGILEKTQQSIGHDDLKITLDEYRKLIKKGKLLESVIHELKEISYQYPIEVSVWQTLGDAYMRANQLQDALDSYTKAEELLR
jgi:tetratricopeptide (TPR) repeat protein